VSCGRYTHALAIDVRAGIKTSVQRPPPVPRKVGRVIPCPKRQPREEPPPQGREERKRTTGIARHLGGSSPADRIAEARCRNTPSHLSRPVDYPTHAVGLLTNSPPDANNDHQERPRAAGVRPWRSTHLHTRTKSQPAISTGSKLSRIFARPRSIEVPARRRQPSPGRGGLTNESVRSTTLQ